jgi:hypothetical protein
MADIISDCNAYSSLSQQSCIGDMIFLRLRPSTREITYTKNFIFWDITPHIPLKVNGYYRETCPFSLQGQRICHTNQHEAERNPIAQPPSHVSQIVMLPHSHILHCYFPVTAKTILLTQMSVSFSNNLCWQLGTLSLFTQVRGG